MNLITGATGLLGSHIAEKLRALTPGAPVLIERFGLNEVDR